MYDNGFQVRFLSGGRNLTWRTAPGPTKWRLGMSGNQLQFRPGATSDVRYPPTVEQVVAAMCGSRRNRPLPLALVVRGYAFGLEGEEGEGSDPDVTLPVVPTALRLMFIEDFELPEYEFEGWVLSDDDPEVWVRGWLRTDARTGEVQEASLLVLEPGQAQGTHFNEKQWGLDYQSG
jgi:hypothetical protein